MSSATSMRHAVAHHRVISVVVALLAAVVLSLALMLALGGSTAAGGSPAPGGGSGGHAVPIAR